MPGIVVGMDGSLHARHALDWARREAAMRHAALTVLAVNPAMASPWTGNPLIVPNDAQTERQVREAAQEAVAKSASDIGEDQPASVTVAAFAGFPAQALILDAIGSPEMFTRLRRRRLPGFLCTLPRAAGHLSLKPRRYASGVAGTRATVTLRHVPPYA